MLEMWLSPSQGLFTPCVIRIPNHCLYFAPCRRLWWEACGGSCLIVSEDLAKSLLAPYGLLVPPGQAAQTPKAAAAIAQKLGGVSFVVKALIPAGGRGKAGGVKVCASIETVTEAAQVFLGHDLLGYRVDSVLVEKALPIAREIYAGVVGNSAPNRIDLVLSFTGGMEIEQAAQSNSQVVWLLPVEPGIVLPVHAVRQWLRQTRVEEFNLEALASVLGG